MPVYVPIYGIHHDEQFYPNPEKFMPERFEQEIPNYAFIPFGNGKCLFTQLSFILSTIVKF